MIVDDGFVMEFVVVLEVLEWLDVVEVLGGNDGVDEVEFVDWLGVLVIEVEVGVIEDDEGVEDDEGGRVEF